MAGLFGRKSKKQQYETWLEGDTAARSAVDARNLVKTEAYNAETAYRGGLIASQRGGLASTILNLGGAAGDPNTPYASQAVGTEAAGMTPELEQYTGTPYAPKKNKGLASTFVASKLLGL